MVFLDLGGALNDVDVNYEAWQVTLDRLELDVMRTERALASDGDVRTDQWDVPADHGPIPEDLRQRAQDIAARQQVLLEQISTRLGQTLRQQAVTDQISRSSTRNPQQPVYVDVNA